MYKVILSIGLLWFSAMQVSAQDRFWVQVEAHPTLAEATDRARVYAQRFGDVQGYYLGTGFYGIALGPYTENLARSELARLRGSRQIPSDSYLQNGRGFEQQFWPIGGASNTAAVVTPQEPEPLAPVSISGVQETVGEARVSEANLTRESREEVQLALQWSGFYNSGIDGAFGRGTRRAMEEWQVANSQQPTGVLTTQQRRALLEQYNADLQEAGMALITSTEAGIAMEMPAAFVAFTEFQPPFVKYGSRQATTGVEVLLISQTGDAQRLAGLYQLMQVLEIIPPDGPRSLRGNEFTIEGFDADVHSFTRVSLENGEIKGFTLVWDTGDERRRLRVLSEMEKSFRRLEGTLDTAIVPASADQSVDMIAGLSVRQPELSRSGFYVTDDGLVVTTSQAIDSCQRITIDRNIAAEVLASYDDFGLTVLRPLQPIAPLDFATFQTDIPRLQDDIALGGYPFDGVLPAPTLNFGTLVDLRDLSQDDRISRLDVAAEPSNAGGPVMDASGAVLGMLLPRSGTAQTLPPEVQFSLKGAVIADLLERAGIAARLGTADAAKSPFALQRQATDMTVLVSCW